MRRVAVVAHVRGNKAALDAVLAAIDVQVPPVDQIVVTGDYAGDGPHPRRVEKKLEKRGLLPPPVIDEEPALSQYLINPASAGYPSAGDPRASFAILQIDGEQIAELQHVPVSYPLGKTVRAELKKIDRGKIDPKHGLGYLRGLIGDQQLVDKDPPLTADMKGAELAIALLATRAFRVYGLGSLDWPEDQVEHVHDLRVANRRLREALSLAAPILRKRGVERANRRARKLGRVLGARRIFDVLLEETKKIADEEKLDLSSFLTFLEARRDKATIEVHVEFSKRKLIRHALKLLELAMWPIDHQLTLAAIAPGHIEERASEVEAQLGFVADENAHDEHHELRIKLKHLRYSAEILRTAWPEVIALEKTVEPVKALQDGLGELNDDRELRGLAEEHSGGKLSGELARFAEVLEARRAKRYADAAENVRATAPALLAEMRAIAAAIRGGA